MRILFLTLEFSAKTFSGNGVYGQSQVRGLKNQGHTVLVISGKPQALHAADHEQLKQVELSTWGRLDRHSSFEQYSQACKSLHQYIEAFAPDIILGVDWSAKDAALAFSQHLSLPYIFLNYRVFLRTALPEDEDFYRQQEGEALQKADRTVVLNSSDAQFIVENFSCADRPLVLIPCLREDVTELAKVEHMVERTCDGSGAASRKEFLTCCVRLSPEKQPERFVELVIALHKQGLFANLKIVPVLAGATISEYAEEQRGRLREKVPSAKFIEHFLSPEELKDLFSRTLLNFHPPKTEAYGMTIVEAAAFGAPSVINSGDGVGAIELLRESEDQCIQLDYNQGIEALAEQVATLLQNPQKLAQTGRNAARKATSWTEAANAQQLTKIMQECIAEKQCQSSV